MLRYPGNDPENGPAYDPNAKDRWGFPKYDEYGNRIYHRKDGKLYEMSRKMKREWRKYPGSDPVQDAYYLGGSTNRNNPYPPGKRYDAFEYGRKTADPLGGFHGRNE